MRNRVAVRRRKAQLRSRNQNFSSLFSTITTYLRWFLLVDVALIILIIAIAGYLFFSIDSSWQGKEAIVMEFIDDTNEQTYYVGFNPSKSNITIITQDLNSWQLADIANGKDLTSQEVLADAMALQSYDSHNFKIQDQKDIATKAWVTQLIWSYIRDNLTKRSDLALGRDLLFFARDVSDIGAITLSSYVSKVEVEIEEGSIERKTVFDTKSWDEKITQVLTPSSQSLSSATVSFINTTEQSGLASQMSRYVSNAGLDVLTKKNGREEIVKSEVMYDSKEVMDSVAGQVMQTIFNELEHSVKDTSEYRSDIVVMLGRDIN